MTRAHIAYIPSSHLDLFWLGNYKTCLDRGAEIIKQYVDRCVATEDETFLIESVVFAAHFLARFPEYREALARLVREGRVEVGAAYVDRWENLILGESHIRNIQLGKEWYREALGLDNALVTHPDLPGLVPQIAQIYAQAGIRYYVTSRKVYAHGSVWRYRAPDGSTLLMLNWPRHYVYVPLDLADIPDDRRGSLWVAPLDLEATQAGFPRGVIPISGSAGDLADRETFRQRYGASLEDAVAANRARYPEIEFTYTTPSRLLRPYEDATDIPEQAGEVPSVWGVAADEEVAFFRRDRHGESMLLTAETLAAVAEHLGLDWRPATTSTWQGTFYEGAFFARKDPISRGHEFHELWRMHVFTQDHNGGGQEGALSSFQKRVIQERLDTYSGEIIDHTLDQVAGSLAATGDCLLVFNPHGRAWSGPLAVTVPEDRWAGGDRVLDQDGQALVAQVERRLPGAVTVQVAVPDVPAVGYRAFGVGRGGTPTVGPHVLIDDDVATLRLRNAVVEVVMDRRTGSIAHLVDLHRSQEWGGADVGRLSAVREVGTDVTLRTDESQPPLSDALVRIDDPESGPLFTRVCVHKTLHDATVEQTVTLWADAARVDVEVRLYWWGAHDLQLRCGLPSVPDTADITYGSPFYSAGWDDALPDAAPRNRDEILPDDYAHYREVQGWLHLRGAMGGLTVCTAHPAFHHGAEGLAAVLMRTSPSCGDNRLYWENAGEQVYRFVFLLGEQEWREADVSHHGASYLKPPVARLGAAQGGGQLPSTRGFLEVNGDGTLLSSLYPAATPGTTFARLYDALGTGGSVRVSGALAAACADAVDLLGGNRSPLAGQSGAWHLALTPWRIQTIRLGS